MSGFRTSDYDYDLPPGLIAQHPAERRDDSRLMVVHRASGTIEHRRFRDIIEYVAPADVLVLNVTRVLRARLLGTRDSGAPAEIFVLRRIEGHTFEAMVHPGGKLKPGRMVHVAPEFRVEILEVTDRRTRVVRFHTSLDPFEALDRFGHIPLPPYIDRNDAAADVERYQTVYGREQGSVAAPTAGLHFTPELLGALERRGVRRADVVLHVGAGTFRPVEVDDPAQHVMHEESYSIPETSAAIINGQRAHGGRIWAVGTTSVRTLESSARERTVHAGSGDTSIFIRPPYSFQAVDCLITNFHLPRSTLLMLVAAFAGYELTMTAYRTAVAEGYRFYSYGDAMVIL